MGLSWRMAVSMQRVPRTRAATDLFTLTSRDRLHAMSPATLSHASQSLRARPSGTQASQAFTDGNAQAWREQGEQQRRKKESSESQRFLASGRKQPECIVGGQPAHSCSCATDRDSVREHGAQRGVLLRSVDAEEGVQDGVMVVLDGFLHEGARAQSKQRTESRTHSASVSVSGGLLAIAGRSQASVRLPLNASSQIHSARVAHVAHVAHSLARKFAHE